MFGFSAFAERAFGETSVDASVAPIGVAASIQVGSAFASAGAPGVAAPVGVLAVTSIGQTITAADAKISAAGVAGSAQVGSASATGGAPAAATPAGVSALAINGTVAVLGSAGTVAAGVAVAASVGIAAAVGGGAGVAQPAGVAATTGVRSVAAAGYVNVLANGIAAFTGAGSATATGVNIYARAPLGSGYSVHRAAGAYRASSLRQITAPIALAVSLAEAKETLRIDDDDTSLDAMIGVWIRGVTAEAEHTARCLFVNRRMRVTLDEFSHAVRLAAPTYSVESVSFLDATGAQQTLDPQDYVADKTSRPGYVVPAQGRAWPETAAVNAVTVDFTAGYGPDETTVPDCARLYILARLAEQWEPSTKKFEQTSQSVYITKLLQPLKVYA